MFKITNFHLCVIGMLVGIGFMSALPFTGLSCRWRTAGGSSTNPLTLRSKCVANIINQMYVSESAVVFVIDLLSVHV
jgi:hypothetical protein